MSAPTYTTVVFDLGDVLFSWSPSTKTAVSSKDLKRIMGSWTWAEYECGRLSEADCYEKAGDEFGLDPVEIRRALEQARASMKPNLELIAAILDLKARSNGQLRVFAMTNMSVPDYEFVQTNLPSWSMFDRVFASCEAGKRKPSLSFYKHVISVTNIIPDRAIFIDDKFENVFAARSLSLHGIVFDNSEHVIRTLYNLIGNPIVRGQEFLRENAGCLRSVTDGGLTVQENTAQLLILEAAKDLSLVCLDNYPQAWVFSSDGATAGKYFQDIGTTSLDLTIVKRDVQTAMSVMDEILKYVDEDGILRTHFDHKKAAFDPVVCANALTLFYSYGRGSELKACFEWISGILSNRAYLKGTPCYLSPESFLFFVGRLVDCTDSPEVVSLKPLLNERIRERIGAEGDALALAMRILTCSSMGIRDEVDLRTLLTLQCRDGGWEMGWSHRYGKAKLGNRGLTTALALKAIKAMEQYSHGCLPLPSIPSSTGLHSFRHLKFSTLLPFVVFSIGYGCRRAWNV